MLFLSILGYSSRFCWAKNERNLRQSDAGAIRNSNNQCPKLIFERRQMNSGYRVPDFAPDTCAWRLELPFGFAVLVVTCRVGPASAVSHADGLGLNPKDLWQLFTQAKGPTAQGGLLKKMFSKHDPMLVACATYRWRR